MKLLPLLSCCILLCFGCASRIEKGGQKYAKAANTSGVLVDEFSKKSYKLTPEQREEAIQITNGLLPSGKTTGKKGGTPVDLPRYVLKVGNREYVIGDSGIIFGVRRMSAAEKSRVSRFIKSIVD